MRELLAIDGSTYQKHYDGAVLRAGGVELAVLKTDIRFTAASQELAEGGIALAAYTWLDPSIPAAPQGKAALDRIATAAGPVRFIAVDFEQWWAVWGEWYQALAKKLTWKAVTKLAPETISRRGCELANWLRENSGLPVLIYTSSGFVKSYAPQAARWLGRYPLWVSHWKRQPASRTVMSWEQVRTNWVPDYEPLLPPGVNSGNVVGHQFSGDRIVAPGIYGDAQGKRTGPADISVFDRDWLESLSQT